MLQKVCYEEEVQPYRKTYYKPMIYKYKVYRILILRVLNMVHNNYIYIYSHAKETQCLLLTFIEATSQSGERSPLERTVMGLNAGPA